MSEPNPHTVINLDKVQVCTSTFSFLRKGAVQVTLCPNLFGQSWGDLARLAVPAWNDLARHHVLVRLASGFPPCPTRKGLGSTLWRQKGGQNLNSRVQLSPKWHREDKHWSTIFIELFMTSRDICENACIERMLKVRHGKQMQCSALCKRNAWKTCQARVTYKTPTCLG